MAQFDLLIIFPLIWSLLLLLFFYYSLSIKVILPNFLSIKKMKIKKINYYLNLNKIYTSNLFFN